MDKRLFKILLIPMYLLIVHWLFFMMFNSIHLNLFFYFIMLMFIPCAYTLSLLNRENLNFIGMIGFIALGILLPASPSFEYTFQDYNGWIQLGAIAIIFGISGFVYQMKRKN